MQDMLVSPAKHPEPGGTKAIVADSLLTEQLMPLTKPGVYRIWLILAGIRAWIGCMIIGAEHNGVLGIDPESCVA